MKRILALIMVLAMVFAFAACKSKDDGATTTGIPPPQAERSSTTAKALLP